MSFLKICTKMDKFCAAFMPYLTVTGVALGILLGDRISSLSFLVNPFFAFMTFSNTLGITIDDFKNVIRRPRPIFVFLASTYVILPLAFHLIAGLLYSFSSPITLGFVLLYSIPTAVVSVIWSSINGGNRALSLTLLIIGTFLAPISTPLTIHLFSSSNVEFDTSGIVRSLFLIVLVPSFLAILIGKLTKDRFPEVVVPYTRPFAKSILLFIVMLNVSQISGDFLAHASLEYLKVGVNAMCFTFLSFFTSYIVSRKVFHIGKSDAVSVTFASSMRNISAALILAISYFPMEVSIPVIFGIVIQQMTSAVSARILFGKSSK